MKRLKGVISTTNMSIEGYEYEYIDQNEIKKYIDALGFEKSCDDLTYIEKVQNQYMYETAHCAASNLHNADHCRYNMVYSFFCKGLLSAEQGESIKYDEYCDFYMTDKRLQSRFRTILESKLELLPNSD